jgi:hypothetical protein
MTWHSTTVVDSMFTDIYLCRCGHLLFVWYGDKSDWRQEPTRLRNIMYVRNFRVYVASIMLFRA